MPNPEQPSDNTWWTSRTKVQRVYVLATATHALNNLDRFVIYYEALPSAASASDHEAGPILAYPLKLWYSRFKQEPAQAQEKTHG